MMESNPLFAFHLLAKPAGAICNLACQYCFYLSKEQLYPGSRFRMSDQVLDAYLQQLLEAQPSSEVNIAWQGGEPTLMGLDFFKHSVDLAKKHQKSEQHVSFSLQTNGVRLDDDWCAFFKKHNFLIGLSIDGPPAMHNAYRLDKAGQGTFNAVKRAWDLLQKHRVDTNILCTLHAANASHPLEVYRFFRDELHARFIQFIPIVERLAPKVNLAAADMSTADASVQGERERQPRKRRHRLNLDSRLSARVSSRSVKPRQFGEFLIAVFNEWIQHDVGVLFVQTFDSALASWYGLPANVCIFQETCGLALALEHNGDLYSCDHFVEPAYHLGNILETPLAELVASPRQRQFGLDKRDRLPGYCLACDVRFACQGECPRNRFLKPPGGKEALTDQPLNYLCAGYKMFFHHIDNPMRLMANLLRQGRAPAEIMAQKGHAKNSSKP